MPNCDPVVTETISDDGLIHYHYALPKHGVPAYDMRGSVSFDFPMHMPVLYRQGELEWIEQVELPVIFDSPGWPGPIENSRVHAFVPERPKTVLELPLPELLVAKPLKDLMNTVSELALLQRPSPSESIH